MSITIWLIMLSLFIKLIIIDRIKSIYGGRGTL